jgi:hypothetical protein
MRYAADVTFTGLGFGYWTDLLVVLASTLVYLAFGFWLFIIVENKARRDATLEEY